MNENLKIIGEFYFEIYQDFECKEIFIRHKLYKCYDAFVKHLKNNCSKNEVYKKELQNRILEISDYLDKKIILIGKEFTNNTVKVLDIVAKIKNLLLKTKNLPKQLFLTLFYSKKDKINVNIVTLMNFLFIKNIKNTLDHLNSLIVAKCVDIFVSCDKCRHTELHDDLLYF
ncbi:hypothetical protein EDEG_03239 [Edhazardia aedis USNM 41457]|uniref:Uncharacterized protein n=1 Tax=Edhazardia aedis (strain USNM 41457) TaxID=1003232 RepID=J9DLT0_EDHAE|nr:hypothetical protein EDEG_03239 [Edhazardia aedis USNM 41457]|eukprot:EJW02337.1 hypothetical protein EDEG_03239 [Edhazardia aedis USNM 41457]